MINVKLKSGELLSVDMFLFAAGRSGNIKELQCDKIGLKVGSREQVIVDAEYRTNLPHIFAVGDVIGFPALASTSMDRAGSPSPISRTQDLERLPSHFPYGIYTIPEVSMVADTAEEDAVKRNLSFCFGKARYSDMPRGKILGTKERVFSS